MAFDGGAAARAAADRRADAAIQVCRCEGEWAFVRIFATGDPSSKSEPCARAWWRGFLFYSLSRWFRLTF